MIKWLLIGPVMLTLSLAVSAVAVRNKLDQQFAGDHFANVVSLQPRSFTAGHDGLNIIILEGKNPGLADVSNFELVLRDEQGQLVQRLPFSGRNFGDPGAIRLQFAPLPSSTGKRLTTALSVVGQSTSQFLADSENRLALRVYYRLPPPGRATLSLSLQSLVAQVKADPVFLGLWMAVLLTVVGLLSGPFRIPGDRRP